MEEIIFLSWKITCEEENDVQENRSIKIGFNLCDVVERKKKKKNV